MTQDSGFGNIRNRRIEEEMRSSYLDYAMSVIVSRALPDVRDGLKPVQRRILYAMDQAGHAAGHQRTRRAPPSSVRSSASTTPTATADLRRDGALAQPFIDALPADRWPGQLRLRRRRPTGRLPVHRSPPLADRDGAARRHRKATPSTSTPTYDGAHEEPLPLPARLPNLLLNGASGIAVGMATNIPPHNLGELCDAIALLIEHPEATNADSPSIVKGPDFPTGGIVFRYETHRIPSTTGRRHESSISATRSAPPTPTAAAASSCGPGAHRGDGSKANRNAIIVTELPFQTNKADADREDRRPRARQADRGHRRPARRVRPPRHAHRHRAEAEAHPRQLLNAALQAHRRCSPPSPSTCWRWWTASRSTVSLKKMLESYIDHRRDVIRRRSRVRPREGAGARAHPGRPAQGAQTCWTQ